MSSTTAFGQRAEGIAAAHLESRGMQIVERNVHVGGNEIDIVALDGDVIVICEVKARSRPGIRPALAINRAKIHRLSKAMVLYTKKRGWTNRKMRFDVVEVLYDGAEAHVTYIRSAFPFDPSAIYR